MSEGDSRDEENASLLAKLHEGLELLAPGDNTLTKEAFHRILPLPDKPKILDIGCGAGRSSLVLAENCPGARIEAIDLYQPFLNACEASARSLGFKIATRRVSMEDLADEIEEESVDLIWSEGAAYVMGFENALESWSGLLRRSGAMVVSELCWLKENPPEELVSFWEKEYPDMASVEESAERANNAGLQVFDRIILPEGAWEAYYGPLEDRCDALEPRADEKMKEIIAATRREIEIFRRFKDFYGYVLFLMRRK